jgi:hypothetical protein
MVRWFPPLLILVLGLAHALADAAVVPTDWAVSNGTAYLTGVASVGSDFVATGAVRAGSGTSATGQLLVVKLAADGTVVWQKVYGAAASNFGTTVVPTADGGVIVGAIRKNTTTDGEWILKLDANGGITWQRVLSAADSISAAALVQTSDLGYVLAGSENGNRVAYVVKLDADGNVTWQRRYSSDVMENEAHAIVETSDGYVVAGRVKPVGTGTQPKTAWLVKLDTTGMPVWQKTYGVLDAALALLPVGSDFLVAGGTAYLLKVDTTGSLLSSSTIGSNSTLFAATALAKLANGDIAVAGGTGTSLPTARAWTIVLDTNNTIVAQHAYGDPGNGILALAPATDGGFAFADTPTVAAGGLPVFRVDTTGALTGECAGLLHAADATLTASTPTVTDTAATAIDGAFTTTTPSDTAADAGLAFASTCQSSAVTSSLDHFLVYAGKTTAKAPKVIPFGPVTLTDAVRMADYDVSAYTALGLPANKNQEGVHDAVTHLARYAVKPHKGAAKFAPTPDVAVLNQCGSLVVTLKKPDSLLVPVDENPSATPPVPDPSTSQVDHFVCYAAKTQTKRTNGTKVAGMPKGVQVDIVDDFETKRFDLQKPTHVCFPTAKSGSPKVLKTGADFPITPATIRDSSTQLVCYAAKQAKVTIPQTGCGPTTPNGKGTKIVPPPTPFEPQTALHVNGQLGPLVVDAKKPLELCVPSTATLP